MGTTSAEITIELARAREEFLEMASDTCRITRVAKVGDAEFVAQVINETTGQYPAQGRVTIYHGPCRTQVKADINSNVVESTAGEREWTYLTSQLQLPVLTPTGHDRYVSGSPGAVDVDHVAELLAVPHQPTSVGSRFTIQGPYHKSQAAYLRFRVKEEVA